VVTVVWWPQLDVVSVEHYSRRRRIHSQIRALTGHTACAGGFDCVSAGITSLNVRDRQGAGGSSVGNRHATAEAAAKCLETEFAPIDDMRASAAFRRRVLSNLMRRFRLETGGARVVTRIDDPQFATV
jgi:hypothetical protein